MAMLLEPLLLLLLLHNFREFLLDIPQVLLFLRVQDLLFLQLFLPPGVLLLQGLLFLGQFDSDSHLFVFVFFLFL